MPDYDSGPWQIVAQLRDWAEATPWCQWLELAGSLGRGAGDQLSDVDAGIGVDRDYPFTRAREEALAAATAFSPVADSLIQPFGTDPAPSDHVIIQYADGRALSLVLSLGHLRPGLPPGAQATFDRTGQLAKPWQPDSFTASPAQQHEWAFLAWLALSDVTKHIRRGSLWRALTSLDQARNLAWKLHAASLGVDYPSFGPISVANAGLPAPGGMEHSLPARPDRALLLAAATALSVLLDNLTCDLNVEGIHRLAAAGLSAQNDEA